MRSKFFFIICPIISSVLGEFILKIFLKSTSLSINLDNVFVIITNPAIILGVVFIGLSAILWIVGMSKFQLSFMYPFLSLNYVIIIIGSDLFLNEDVKVNRYIALFMIVLGLLFISRSKNINIKES